MSKSIKDIVTAMHDCEQTKGQSVFQHGESVRDYYKDIFKYIMGQETLYEWKIPDWFDKYCKRIAQNQHNTKTTLLYTLYHDCGKPFCREVDEDGRVHFPNHAEVSKRVFLETFGQEDVANLIGWDMIIHISTADEIEHYCKNVWSIKDAMTLLLVSMAEVHSNAALFGGVDTVSFKSKWKKVSKRGKQICKFFFKEVD